MRSAQADRQPTLKYGPKPVPLFDRLWAKVCFPGDPDDCWVWTGAQGGGKPGKRYGYILVADQRMGRAHCLVYEAFWGPVPAGMEVCHSCNNSLCCNPTHLYAGTRADNMQQCVRDRRHTARGDSIDAETKAAIRAALGAETYRQIRDRFGVGMGTIALVARQIKEEGVRVLYKPTVRPA